MRGDPKRIRREVWRKSVGRCRALARESRAEKAACKLAVDCPQPLRELARDETLASSNRVPRDPATRSSFVPKTGRVQFEGKILRIFSERRERKKGEEKKDERCVSIEALLARRLSKRIGEEEFGEEEEETTRASPFSRWPSVVHTVCRTASTWRQERDAKWTKYPGSGDLD